jgi:hypothetical protein
VGFHHAPVMKKRQMKQTEIEQHYFEQFQKAHLSLPEGPIAYRDKPDVIITGSGTLGIEITNFYLEDGASTRSEQMQSCRRKSVVSEAQKLYTKNGGKNIELHFGFKKEQAIEDVRTVAQSIAALVPSLEDRANGQVPRSAYVHIPELNFMYLYARQLQFSDEPVPGFAEGEPDRKYRLSSMEEVSRCT